MTRQEAIYRCIVYVDHFNNKTEGVLTNLKTILKECGFRYHGSRVLNDKIIFALFPGLGKFDLRLPDIKYKMSVLKAVYYSCKNSVTADEHLKKDLEKYDILIDPREEDPFW